MDFVTSIGVSQTVMVAMDAFGKARPRVTKGGSHTYMPVAYKNSQELLQLLFGRVVIAPPYSIRLLVTRRMPKSWSKAKRERMTDVICTTTPDIDNALGGVMDTLVKQNDNAVVYVECLKVWGHEATMWINITQLVEDSKVDIASFML